VAPWGKYPNPCSLMRLARIYYSANSPALTVVKSRIPTQFESEIEQALPQYNKVQTPDTATAHAIGEVGVATTRKRTLSETRFVLNTGTGMLLSNRRDWHTIGTQQNRRHKKKRSPQGLRRSSTKGGGFGGVCPTERQTRPNCAPTIFQIQVILLHCGIQFIHLQIRKGLSKYCARTILIPLRYLLALVS
jgi:hypothetical protein